MAGGGIPRHQNSNSPLAVRHRSVVRQGPCRCTMYGLLYVLSSVTAGEYLFSGSHECLASGHKDGVAAFVPSMLAGREQLLSRRIAEACPSSSARLKFPCAPEVSVWPARFPMAQNPRRASRLLTVAWARKLKGPSQPFNAPLSTTPLLQPNTPPP